MLRDSDYWVGSLSMTIACATKTPYSQAVLKTALREFLKDRPVGDNLGDKLRSKLKEKT